MTEAEWLTCAVPPAMFRTLRGRWHVRKCRLFAVACCRSVQPGFPDARSRAAVDIAEQHADGLATDEQLASVRKEAEDAHRDAFRRWGKTGACLEWGAEFVAWPQPYKAAKNVSWAVVN